MDWIRSHQAKSIFEIAGVFIIEAVILGFLTWASLEIATALKGTAFIILLFLLYSPISIFPFIIGLTAGLFLLDRPIYMQYIPAAVIYFYFAVAETIRAISQSDTSRLAYTWLLVPVLVAVVGTFMLAGAFIAKKIVKQRVWSTEYRLHI